MIYDLAIIGAGPGGGDAAEYAAARGLSVVLFEKNKLGGVCLNEGCIPTKTLLQGAHTYAHARDAKKYAVSTADVALEFDKLMSRKSKILRKLSAGIRMGLQKHGVQIVEGEASLAGREGDTFRITCAEQSYQARKVILATGSTAFVPPIPGLAEGGYWTAKEALEMSELPKSVAVVGGGVIGMEFVSFFSTLGIPVTVIEMLPKILGGMDAEISSELQQALSKRGVKFHLSTRVEEIREGRIIATAPEGTVEVEAERILISAGRRPVIAGLGLETLEVTTERGAIMVDDYLRTNVEGLYAVGDVNGRSMLAHTAARQGIVAVEHILGGSEAMSYRAIPGIVYTDPELASVGRTEEELQSSGTPYQVHKVPMALSGRFVIENEMGNGICKLLTDEQGILIGAHLIGNGSSEILAPAIMAIERGMSLRELSSIVFPHPTVCEILRLAALH